LILEAEPAPRIRSRLAPQEQRQVQVAKLAASLELGDLGEYWEGEIQRRVQDVDAGRVATIPADEVFARLEQRFGGK
jgi:putative addiction module component (TIGR02574 family)